MFRLQWYFSVASLVSVAVAIAALAIFYRQVAVRDLVAIGEHSNVDKTIMLSNHLGPKVLSFRDAASALPAEEIRSHRLTRELDDEVRKSMRGHEVVKVKFYDLAGKTIYSSDPTQIGEDKSANAGFVSARAGTPASELTHRDTFSAFEAVIEDRDVLSSYVPQRGSGSDRIEGVFEIYEDVTPLLGRIETTQRVVVLGVTAVMLLLYGILFLIVHRADTILRGQDAELRNAAATLKRLNEDLESRVQERTAVLAQTGEKLRKLSRAVEQSPASIIITDTAGTIEYVNPTFCEVTGYSADEAIGRTPRMFKSGATSPAVYADLWRTITAGAVWRGELCNRKKDGELYWEQVSISPVTETGRSVTHMVAVKQDITAIKEAEQRIHELNETLEQRVVERTAELHAANDQLESFSYSVSHDLRAPLRAIAGFSAILAADAPEALDAEHRALIDRIAGNVRKMQALIDDLLEFSRSSSVPMSPAPFALGELAREVASGMQDTYPRAVIEIKELPRVSADRSLLRQVFVNLIANALKFSAKREHPRVEIGLLKRDGESVVYVRDNGAGFDAAHADRLFGIFQRLHRAEEFEGTGVGLAIVRRVVERHGGRIWAEAEINKGATFYFTVTSAN